MGGTVTKRQVVELRRIYGEHATLPFGVRLRIALDVLEALGELGATLGPRTRGSRLRLERIVIDREGVAGIEGQGELTGAAALAWEILSGPGTRASLSSIPSIPQAHGITGTIRRAMVDRSKGSVTELAAALAEASRDVIDTHASVRAAVERAGIAFATVDAREDLDDIDMQLPEPRVMLSSLKKTRAGLFGMPDKTTGVEDEADRRRTVLFRRRLPRFLDPKAETSQARVVLSSEIEERLRATQLITRMARPGASDDSVLSIDAGARTAEPGRAFVLFSILAFAALLIAGSIAAAFFAAH